MEPSVTIGDFVALQQGLVDMNREATEAQWRNTASALIRMGQSITNILTSEKALLDERVDGLLVDLVHDANVQIKLCQVQNRSYREARQALALANQVKEMLINGTAGAPASVSTRLNRGVVIDTHPEQTPVVNTVSEPSGPVSKTE